MTTMRAKLRVTFVQEHFYGPDKSKSAETVRFCAVAASKYPADGADENNTYAKFSPQADLSITIANPALWGKFETGQEYYTDFTKA
jgi:hypothetical protein